MSARDLSVNTIFMLVDMTTWLFQLLWWPKTSIKPAPFEMKAAENKLKSEFWHKSLISIILGNLVVHFTLFCYLITYLRVPNNT